MDKLTDRNTGLKYKSTTLGRAVLKETPGRKTQGGQNKTRNTRQLHTQTHNEKPSDDPTKNTETQQHTNQQQGAEKHKIN